jgi:hypothetical protein
MLVGDEYLKQRMKRRSGVAGDSKKIQPGSAQKKVKKPLI